MSSETIQHIAEFIESKGLTEEATQFLLDKRGQKTDLASLLNDSPSGNDAVRPAIDYSKIYPIVKEHAGSKGINTTEIIAKAIEAGIAVVQDSKERSRIKTQLNGKKGKEQGFTQVPDSSTFKYDAKKDQHKA